MIAVWGVQFGQDIDELFFRYVFSQYNGRQLHIDQGGARILDALAEILCSL
jgi:hypothetical protein